MKARGSSLLLSPSSFSKNRFQVSSLGFSAKSSSFLYASSFVLG